MTKHLTPAEITEALDGSLGASRRAHLDTCSRCRTEVASFETMAKLAKDAADVPEPSPFFWNSLAGRIRMATANAPIVPESRWRQEWLPALAVAAALVIAVAVGVRISRVDREALPVSQPGVGASSDVTLPQLDDPWLAVESVVSDLSADDVRRVMAPTPSVAPLIDDLSPHERAAFVELLRAEWEGTR